ncbi:MAG: fimbrillin family protein [Rikenellaceae bacterium]
MNNMFKMFFRAAIVAIVGGVVFSCNKAESGVEDSQEKKAIEVSTVCQTRGEMLGSENFKTLSLYAYHKDDTQLMNDNIFTKVGDKWNPEVIHYWPNSDEVIDFYGYAPCASSNNGLVVDGETKTITYDMPTSVVDQPDLVVASASESRNSEGVLLTFDHVLALIKFSVVGNGTSSIESITIEGISSKGDFSMVEKKWLSIEDPSSEVFEAKIISDISDATEETQLTTSDGYIFAIPQEGSVTVRVENSNGDTTDKTFDIDWQAGKPYNYIITLGKADTNLTGEQIVGNGV